MHSVRRLLRGDDGQSTVLGTVFIIGMTLAAASTVVVIGSVALEDTQQRSQIGQAEQALTQFDSRVAQVALGGSTSQTVDIGQSAGGQYHLEPDSGHVTVVHENRTGVGDEAEIYNSSLGALVYTEGDTEIAYQGGGVWRGDGDGDGATMISPPEFHYRDATLTFPIITVTGSGAASGGVSATVSQSGTPAPVFPRDDTYDDGERMENPISNGTMRVTIESPYCQGWKRYFETRTDGNVSDCSNGNVSAEIFALGTQGDFSIIKGEELTLRGIESLQEFELEFRVDQEGAGQNSGFNNFEWSMSAENGNQQFELFIEEINGGPDCPDDDASEPANVVMYYSDDGGNAYSTWKNDEDFEIVCDGEEPVLVVDLLSDHDMNYTAADAYSGGGGGGSNSLPRFAGDADTLEDPTTVDGRSNNPGDTETMENVTRYYVDQMGNMNLEIREGNNAGISDSSSGTVEYTGNGRVITFLHVTENEVEVELN